MHIEGFKERVREKMFIVKTTTSKIKGWEGGGC